MAAQKIPCTVEILTLNSEKQLEKCLESVKEFDDIIILDGNSTDRTREIAQTYGARIFSQNEGGPPNVRIDDFSRVRDMGVSLARHGWFLYIDSDEYLSKEALQEIRDVVSKKERVYGVYKLPRKYVLNDEVIERASSYPNYQPRLFFIGDTLGFRKRVHEAIKPKPGVVTGILKECEYVPLEDIKSMRKKWKSYLDIQMAYLSTAPNQRLWRGIRANIKKTATACVRTLRTFFGKGKRIPFGYEYYNIMYHVSIVWRTLQILMKRSYS